MRNKLPVMTRRLLLALLLSVLVHAWMVGGLDGWLPDEDSPETTLIQVELVRPASKPVAKPLPETPRPAVPAAAPQPKPVAREKPAERVAVEARATPPDALPAPVEPVVPPTAVVVQSSPPPVDGPVVEEAAPAEAEEPVPQAPSRVVIDYQIIRKGGVAGIEHHSYQAREDGSYVLTSLAEAKGLLALALSDLMQRSEGQVTPRGLRPTSYLYQYGKNVDKAQKASFDWQGGTLTMEVGSRRQTAELQEGTQDLMSFMYQFMFVPPLQDMRLAVTNGKKLKIYNYGFEGEEPLETRMGLLRTLRIGKSGSDGEEKTEIWLAADYHYLPVKISKTEKDGTVTERIATNLQIQE